MTRAEVKAFIDTWIITNGNQEITALVLNPVLQNIVDQINDLTGQLSDLNTTDQTSLVAAINSLKAEFDAFTGGIQIHYGTDDPNLTPPSSFNIVDFYVQELGIDIFALWQYNGIEWVEIRNVIDDSYTGLDKTWSSQKIADSILGISNYNTVDNIKLFQKGYFNGNPNPDENAFIEKGDLAYGLSDNGVLQKGVFHDYLNDDDVQNWDNYQIIERNRYTQVT